MSGDMEGNIARISEVFTYPREGGGENRKVYITVIEDHDRPTGDGTYTRTGRTIYQFMFSRGRYADRIRASFRVGDEVVVTYDRQRAGLDIDPAINEPQPTIRAVGRSIGLTCRTKVLTGVNQAAADAVADQETAATSEPSPAINA